MRFLGGVAGNIYPTKFVRLAFLTISLRIKSSQATLSLYTGSPTRESCEDLQMQHQKSPQIDAYDRQSLRTRQHEDMELLVAVSEVESPCAGWLVDERVNAEFATQEPAS